MGVGDFFFYLDCCECYRSAVSATSEYGLRPPGAALISKMLSSSKTMAACQFDILSHRIWFTLFSELCECDLNGN